MTDNIAALYQEDCPIGYDRFHAVTVDAFREIMNVENHCNIMFDDPFEKWLYMDIISCVLREIMKRG